MSAKGFVTELEVNGLDEQISDILSKALSNYRPEFKNKDGMVQWARVQLAIHDRFHDFWCQATSNFVTAGRGNEAVHDTEDADTAIPMIEIKKRPDAMKESLTE